MPQGEPSTQTPRPACRQLLLPLPERTRRAVKIGYARVSTDGQDLTAQRQGLADLRVQPDRVHVDHGISGIHRARPGLREALAACGTGSV